MEAARKLTIAGNPLGNAIATASPRRMPAEAKAFAMASTCCLSESYVTRIPSSGTIIAVWLSAKCKTSRRVCTDFSVIRYFLSPRVPGVIAQSCLLFTKNVHKKRSRKRDVALQPCRHARGKDPMNLVRVSFRTLSGKTARYHRWPTGPSRQCGRFCRRAAQNRRRFQCPVRPTGVFALSPRQHLLEHTPCSGLQFDAPRERACVDP